MFEKFSAQFESGFRIFFIVWVSFWGFINLSGLLTQYAQFASISEKPTQLGYWWLNTMGTVVTVAIGIFLFFMMVSVAGRIRDGLKINNISLMTAMAVFYYLFVTIVQIFAGAIFKPETFSKDFVFLTAWLLPSIIIMVVHILYFNNLGVYNRSLKKTVNQE
jgi:uncharacterized membrane protein